MKKALPVAVCGVITALSVVLMLMLGAAFIFSYILPMVLGMFMIMIKRSFSTAYAWLTYASTSLLSVFLVAEKECMLMYVLFFGFYPIINERLNKITNKPLRALSKLVIFNSLISIVQLLLVFVFGIPFLEGGEGKWFIILFAVLMNILFVIYDKLLLNLTILYELKIEPKLKNILNKNSITTKNPPPKQSP